MNMMIKKWTAVIAVIPLIFIIVYGVKNTFAQSFFTNKPAVETTAPSQQTMAPNEFRSTVNTIGQQNLNKLSDQVNKQLPKPSPVVKSILSPGSETSKPPAEEAPPTPAPPPVTAIPPAAAPSSSPPPPASPPPLAGPEPSTPPPASPPVQNQEVYTGFGAGKPATETPANNKDSSWDIKY